MSKRNLRWMLALATAFVLAFCKPRSEPENPLKLLQAADAEISGLTKRFTETHGFRALATLYKLSHLELPLKANAANIAESWFVQAQMLEDKYGLSADTSTGHLRIIFPYTFKNDSLAVFELFDYQTQPSFLLDQFPVALECKISSLSGANLLYISHKGNLKNQLPEHYAFYLKSGAFEIRSVLKSHFRRKNSSIQLSLEIVEHQRPKLSLDFSSIVALDADNSIRFGRKNLKISVWPLVIDLRGRNGFHTYDPKHFVRDFNADNQISVFDHGWQKIASIKLADLPGKDYINPVLVWPDGTQTEMENVMTSIRQLLGMKLYNL